MILLLPCSGSCLRKNAYLFPSDWIIASAVLVLLALVVDLIATVLTGVGLNTQHFERKFTFYRVAMYLMFFAGNWKYTALEMSESRNWCAIRAMASLACGKEG